MNETLFAGIDIGATSIKYGLIDAKGNERYRSHTPTPKNSRPESLFAKIVRCGEQLLIEADDQSTTVNYIGVGSPGSINIETGVIQGCSPNIPNWVGFHLRDRMAEQLNLPVFVDNDANCAAIAEHRFGAGKGHKDIICLTVGTGIGGGLILNNEIYRGVNYCAGEIGHMVPWGDNEDPADGRILESLVSSRAILKRLTERLTGNITPAFAAIIGDDLSRLTIRKLFTAIKRKDEIAYEVLISSAEILGTALIGLVNAFNPEMVILGGGVVEGGSIYVDTVRKTIMTRALAPATADLSVVPARLGNTAGFIGAALLDRDNDDDD